MTLTKNTEYLKKMLMIFFFLLKDHIKKVLNLQIILKNVYNTLVLQFQKTLDRNGMGSKKKKVIVIIIAVIEMKIVV